MPGSAQQVPGEFVRALLVRARECGHDVNAILARAQFPADAQHLVAYPEAHPREVHPLDATRARGEALPEDAYLQKGAGVSPSDYNRLCLSLFEALGDEAGGIIKGVTTPLGTTRMLLMSVLHCASLEDVMERAIAFNAVLREPALQSDGELRLRRRGELALLEYRPALPQGKQAAVLCSMAIWLRVCGWLIGRDIDVLHAGLLGPLPRQRAGLQHFFRCPVAVGQSCNWVAFPAHYLHATPVRDEAQLREFLQQAAYRTVIEAPRAEGPLGARLRTLLEDTAHGDWPSFEQLAGRLRMAPRTLRRRLAAEGDSYQRLRDRMRRDRAVADLRAGYSVERTAERAGFNDSSAFHRAFRRWTGVAPGQFR